MRSSVSVLVVATVLSAACTTREPAATSATPLAPLAVSATTGPVADDADDPAVWVNPANPAQSLILGTNKVAEPGGALYVFTLDGTVRQIVKPLDRPNNVDVEYGLAMGSGPIDIAVVSERLQHRLRVFKVAEGGVTPIDGGGIPVCAGETGDAAMPMGIALYRRPRDGAIFAIVAPKTGGTTNYLWQYRLEADAGGIVRGTLVRRFGAFSGMGEIEAVVVDDELGVVYYADEEYGIRKWSADPDGEDADRELAVFGRTGFMSQREGLAILPTGPGAGFVVVSDQVPDASRLVVFRREGRTGDPHDHSEVVATVPTTADSTDGLDISTAPLGPRYPDGLLLMMSSKERVFRLHDLRELRRRIGH